MYIYAIAVENINTSTPSTSIAPEHTSMSKDVIDTTQTSSPVLTKKEIYNAIFKCVDGYTICCNMLTLSALIALSLMRIQFDANEQSYIEIYTPTFAVLLATIYCVISAASIHRDNCIQRSIVLFREQFNSVRSNSNNIMSSATGVINYNTYIVMLHSLAILVVVLNGVLIAAYHVIDVQMFIAEIIKTITGAQIPILKRQNTLTENDN